jgi:hypothetical protein
MNKPSADTATAHKLARMVYFILTWGEEFVGKGYRSTNSSINVNAVLPHSNAAPPRWASSSHRRYPPPEAYFDSLQPHW